MIYEKTKTTESNNKISHLQSRPPHTHMHLSSAQTLRYSAALFPLPVAYLFPEELPSSFGIEFVHLNFWTTRPQGWGYIRQWGIIFIQTSCLVSWVPGNCSYQLPVFFPKEICTWTFALLVIRVEATLDSKGSFLFGCLVLFHKCQEIAECRR